MFHLLVVSARANKQNAQSQRAQKKSTHTRGELSLQVSFNRKLTITRLIKEI